MKYKSTLLLPLCHFFTSATVVFQELPKVIPPTPEAASLFKFMEYPVVYATGIPQIGIPLYEVKNGELSVPKTPVIVRYNTVSLL